MLGSGDVRPQGVLPGHTEGVTHVSARGDGRHLISNGKDSTLRVWDVRKMRSGRVPSVRPLHRLQHLSSRVVAKLLLALACPDAYFCATRCEGELLTGGRSQHRVAGGVCRVA